MIYSTSIPTALQMTERRHQSEYFFSGFIKNEFYLQIKLLGSSRKFQKKRKSKNI